MFWETTRRVGFPLEIEAEFRAVVDGIARSDAGLILETETKLWAIVAEIAEM